MPVQALLLPHARLCSPLPSADLSVSHVCAVLLPGWYARSMSGSIITATGPCPQGFYCECLQALIDCSLASSQRLPL